MSISDNYDDFNEAEPLLWPALWRHKWLIAAATVVFAVLGYVVSSLQGDTYTARAELLLVDPSASGVLEEIVTGGNRYVTNQAAYLESTAVAARAAQALGVSRQAVDGSVSASASTGADVVTITAQRPSASEAAAFANAVAAAYEELRIESLQQNGADATVSLQLQVETIRSRIEELSAELSADPGDVAAQAELDAALAQLSGLQIQISQIAVDAALFGSGVQFFEEANEPGAPSSPQPRRDAILAAAIGLILASGAAWWRHTQLPLANDRQDPAAILDAPLLGEVPVFEASTGAPHLALMGSKAAWAFEFVLGTLGFVLEDLAAPTLVISSARQGDGKTLTALNLAAAAQADGRMPLLIDADERMRGLTTLTGAEDDTGLTDLVLHNNLDLNDAIQQVKVGDTRLWMLTAGTPPTDTAGFFRAPGFRKLMADLQGRAELTIIDTPPLLAVAETANVASQSDGVVVVVDQGTPLRVLGEFKERADLSNIRLVGYVFNRAAARKRYGYGRYGHDKYGYGYGKS